MTNKRGPYLKRAEIVAYFAEHWNKLPSNPEAVKAAMKHFGCTRKRDEDRIHAAWMSWDGSQQTSAIEEEQVPEPVVGGTMEDPSARRTVADAGPRNYVFTCAQNNTELIPEDWWATLMMLVKYYNAELHVSQFTYNKAAYGRKAVKPGSKRASDDQELFYAKEIEPYISNDDIQITPDLVWLGSANLLPTVVNPITGWQTHTRAVSCILPHTKVAMESVATMKNDPAKFVYTTGAITQRNYIQKAAGQKADFHHVFGALLVQVDDNGDWWARQLNFDKDGGLYDLDKFFTPTEVFDQVRVDAVVHGDIHGYKRDEEVCNTVFGPTGMLNTLMPREQFFHDIIDFMPRNHHNRKNFNFLAEMHRNNTSNVWDEFVDIGHWLVHAAHRNWCVSNIVVSNHDQAVNAWLDDATCLQDPVNVVLWLDYNHRRARWPGYHAFRSMMLEACRQATGDTFRNAPRIILEDESYKISGVEFGVHGHLGPNGARGAPRNIKTIGKANTGHTHSAGIVEGVYTAGVLGKLDMGYNKGPSSWSHSSIVQYPNGKRAILTYRAGKWWP